MQRRYAIAVSLALTLIVGSAMVVLGSEVGLFFQHDRNSATATELNGDDEAAALRYLAAISLPPAEAEVYPPDVVTEYDYRYIYETPVPAVPKQAITSPTAKPTTEPAPEVADTDGEDEAPTPRDEAQPTLPARDESVDVDDDEHEDEHEDEHHEDEPQEEDHELATEDD